MANETTALSKMESAAADRIALPKPVEAKEPTVKILRANSEDIHIGENTSFEGSFTTEGAIFVDGQLTKARIQANQLSIGPRGQLEGEVEVSRAEIGGAFAGRITVTSELVLRSTARVEGEVTCRQIVAHRGATLRAQVVAEAANGPDPLAPATTAGPGNLLRRRRRWRGAALVGAFALGGLTVGGAVGTFMLFRFSSMIMP